MNYKELNFDAVVASNKAVMEKLDDAKALNRYYQGLIIDLHERIEEQSRIIKAYDYKACSRYVQT